MKVFLIIFACLVVLLALAGFVGGYLMYRFALVKDKSGKRQAYYWENGGEERGFFLEMNADKAEHAKACAKKIRESITDTAYITSRDGLKLCGHVIDNPAGRGVAVFIHGYRSCSLVDFGVSSDYFYNAGFSLIFVDQRAHGDSEGKRLTFGIKERYDAVDWAKYAAERWADQPIIMCGVSMGAATVMMGAGIGYPANVKAILADCGYSTAGAICRKCLKQWYNLPPFPIYHFAKLWTKWLAGVDLDSVSARKSLENLRGTGTKVLIVHGTGDDFVPYEMSRENIKAFDYMPESARRETMEFLSVEGADHAQSFNVDKEAYLAALDRLFEKAGI